MLFSPIPHGAGCHGGKRKFSTCIWNAQYAATSIQSSRPAYFAGSSNET
jgi:hypothetical protein